MRTLFTFAAATAMLMSTGMASGQTITHWLDRQIHGTARHLTLRHHKPGEPTYASRPERMVPMAEHRTYLTTDADGRQWIVTEITTPSGVHVYRYSR